MTPMPSFRVLPSLGALALAALCALTAGCPRNDTTCGPGTTRNDQGQCTASTTDAGVLVCGAGTQAADGGCVPVPRMCGAGTQLVNGQCVPVPVDGGTPVDAGPVDAGGGADAGADAGTDAGVVTCMPACELGFYCSAGGICLPTPRPASWSCFFENYRDGDICDCACGAFDPDCANTALPVAGCASDQ
jgi:hypothetical protein